MFSSHDQRDAADETTPLSQVDLGGAWHPSRCARQRRGRRDHASADDALLETAHTRIEQHRKGDGVIAVKGADGKPVPGANVKIEQVRHDFRFGCNLFMWGRCDDAQREEDYRRRFAALLNFATLGFYWPYFERERGQAHL